MKYAYLIMAHNDLFCLNHLLQALDDGDNAIFLHLDKKWDINTKKIYSTQNADLHIYQKMDVRWGSFSQIQCEIFLFEQAESNGPYKRYHAISAQYFYHPCVRGIRYCTNAHCETIQSGRSCREHNSESCFHGFLSITIPEL